VDKLQNNADVMRRRILDVAARLFKDNGFAGVSLRAIAAEVGIKAGSLYYHFASKEELIVEILNQGIQIVHDDVLRAAEGVPKTDGRALLRAAIGAHLHSLLKQGDYTSANIRIFGQLPPEVRKRNLQVRRAYEALWDQLISRLAHGRKKKPTARQIRLARLMVIGALNASLEWFDPKRGGVDALSDQYTDLLWQGFSASFSGSERL
jgi:TetR/AcrR family transcriptional regulator, cholesterol catabolism regulator